MIGAVDVANVELSAGEVDLLGLVPLVTGETYLFTHSAWVRMWWATRFQELSELATMGCFLLACMHISPQAARRANLLEIGQHSGW